MTVRELANVAGCSGRTVRRVITLLYPGRMRNGVPTDLSEAESINVMAEIRKRGFVNPRQNDQVSGKNDQVGRNRTILNSSVIREFVKLYGPREARLRIDHLIDFKSPSHAQNNQRQPALPMPLKAASQGFDRIRENFSVIDARKKQFSLFKSG